MLMESGEITDKRLYVCLVVEVVLAAAVRGPPGASPVRVVELEGPQITNEKGE